MKTIDTLVQDINDVISGNGGWTETVNKYFLERIGSTMNSRLGASKEEYKPSLRMSNLGRPCTRQTWYDMRADYTGEELRSATQLKFMFGDILEDLLISLAVAAGHEVTGCQDLMEIDGIKGHRDCVIDGVTIDVKSASSYSFRKFKDHNLRIDDPFGYISQLSSYVYAAKDDPLVTDKSTGGFLVVDKQHGHICLDLYDLTKEIAGKQQEVASIKRTVNSESIPPRGFNDEPEGKSGNRKLGINCSYCTYKEVCWPGLETYFYARGPVFLTQVKRKPKVDKV